VRKKLTPLFVVLIAAFSVLGLAACGGGGGSSTSAAQKDQNYEVNLENILRQKYPLPTLTDSSDLKNQIEYATVQSDPNKLEYLELINLQGNPYFTATIKGQVSAESTRITSPVKDVCDYSGDTGDSCVAMPQPDLTGTYFSQDGGGYFAYTTNGALIQWPASVQFLTSDQPFKISKQVTLQINENAPISPTHPSIQHGLTSSGSSVSTR
jgi:hypothetical protein